MPLEFKDIKDWSPASISIVDKPAHPLAIFEVYENDDEFIKKFKQYSKNEVNNMSENNNEVKMPSSVFERIFGSVIMKSDNADEKPKDEIENIKAELAKAQEEITTLQETIKMLQEKLDEKEDNDEGSKKDDEKNIEEIVDNAVKKYFEEKEDHSENEQEDNSQDDEGSEEDILDDEKFIKKSKSIDPDNLKHSKSEKTFMERIGRTNDGMRW